MDFNRILSLLNEAAAEYQLQEGIMNFIPDDCPHKDIGLAYDKAAKIYDQYILDEGLLLKSLKKIALGIGSEAIEEGRQIATKMLARVSSGIVLDIPAGTGVFTFQEYAKHPQILFIAAEYSLGMLRQAQKKIAALGAENILPIRADVGNLPFKPESFDAVICLNGIHSFPEKPKAIAEMARVLKKGRSLHGSLILGRERWLTDIVLNTAYFRLKWFTRPALDREELFALLAANKLKAISQKLLKAALGFEAVKI